MYCNGICRVYTGKSISEVVEFYNIAGDYDFLLEILVKDMPTYQEFVLGVPGTLKCMGSVKSVFVTGETKNGTSLSDLKTKEFLPWQLGIRV